MIVSQTEDPYASTRILYPTPAEDKVYLRFDHIGFEPETISIALFDLTGHCIVTFMGSEQYISLVGMARGLYIVVV